METSEIVETCLMLTSCQAVSLVSQSRSQERDERSQTSGGYGEISSEPFAIYDPDSSSWKTSQGYLLPDLEMSWEDWPRSGCLRNGRCFRLASSAPHIHESGCSLWPTPRASRGGGNAGGSSSRKTATRNGTYVNGSLNPNLYEWLMGFPI